MCAVGRKVGAWGYHQIVRDAFFGLSGLVCVCLCNIETPLKEILRLFE